MYSSYPFGLRIANLFCSQSSCCQNPQKRITTFKILILVLTFFAYTAYHLSRRPLSVVKTILNRNCSNLNPPSDIIIGNATRNTWCDWEPFNGPDANTLLGTLDSSFLFSYAIFMFFSGFVAERCHLRYFLAIGMIMSGIFTYLFGIAYYYNIHSLYYFIIVQIICGAFQTTGWPAVVTCVGHWFGPRSSRGLIFGIWNSHTNVGNILGAVIAGVFVEYNWGLSFIVPGIIIAVIGFLLFLFLTPYPEEVGCYIEDSMKTKARTASFDGNENDSTMSSVCSSSSNQHQRRKMIRIDEVVTSTNESPFDEEERPLLLESNVEIEVTSKRAVSFFAALKIPGVIEFSLCLFFAKLVSYTFLYWLPKYIEVSMHSSSSDSAFSATPFDFGGIIGAIVAGYLADKTGASASICVTMLFFAIPSLFLFQYLGSISTLSNIIFQIIAGTFVNGPYALITTAVSAELGTKVDNSNALATVTAIIDGTGSIGAAIGPFVAGFVSDNDKKWQNVFYLMMIADLFALISLCRIAIQEIKRLRIRNMNLV